ncbi:MAG: RdgB/HAM1 family non-canonical purine NTP pyrophosphatase [Flavobacteriales bacterium]
MKIIFASHNHKKTEEIRSLLPENLSLINLHDLGQTEAIPEEEPTIEGNSAFKANWVFEKYGLPCFADDTGLEVFALNGEPGVHSARYAGEGRSDAANMQKLQLNLAPHQDRRAQFKTVITYRSENGIQQFTGIVSGEIAQVAKGNQGFGYDPIFCPEGLSRTFAEMDLSEKNKYSHRARALSKLLSFLSQQ